MSTLGQRLLACAVATAAAVNASPLQAQTRAAYEAAREQMVQAAVLDAGVTNKRVIEAMRATPRHEFVPRLLRKDAYKDMSLPIGDQQTISAPFVVAFMTETIDPQPADKVLEIGTGSGYQAAVLSGLVKEVYTIEIVESLGRTAHATLQRLGYQNVHVKVGDGFAGWPDHAPFDKIIVTCSPESVPQPLVDQLKEGGTMVIPVGSRYQQVLYVMRKRDGALRTEALHPTLFVPMTGSAEDARKVQPDPLSPTIANGGFEKALLESGSMPDWYYQRLVTRAADPRAPEGQYYASFANTEPGRPAMAMQGLAIDGRQVRQLTVSAWVKYTDVRPGRDNNELPVIAVTFYDQNRAALPHSWIGPFRGTSDWVRKSETFRVPPEAREAIVRLGLFGAVGELGIDDVRLEGHR